MGLYPRPVYTSSSSPQPLTITPLTQPKRTGSPGLFSLLVPVSSSTSPSVSSWPCRPSKARACRWLPSCWGPRDQQESENGGLGLGCLYSVLPALLCHTGSPWTASWVQCYSKLGETPERASKLSILSASAQGGSSPSRAEGWSLRSDTGWEVKQYVTHHTPGLWHRKS